MENDEIKELKLKLKEKDEILKRNKSYLFLLEFELKNKNKLIKSLKQENNNIKSTMSWKITKPLRYISNFFKK